MLETILHTEGPFECTFRRTLQALPWEAGEDGDDLREWESGSMYQGEAAEHRELFRLRILRGAKAAGEGDKIHAVVLERRQFVGAFVRTFKEFLKTDYLGFIEDGKLKVDLRALPLERLDIA